jgi:hypothetical protein
MHPTGQRYDITTQVQATVPRLGLAYPLVMHGILAMAATHLSRLRPSRQCHYAMIAASKHSVSIPEFRSALGSINERNCDAVASDELYAEDSGHVSTSRFAIYG